ASVALDSEGVGVRDGSHSGANQPSILAVLKASRGATAVVDLSVAVIILAIATLRTRNEGRHAGEASAGTDLSTDGALPLGATHAAGVAYARQLRAGRRVVEGA